MSREPSLSRTVAPDDVWRHADAERGELRDVLVPVPPRRRVVCSGLYVWGAVLFT